MSLALPVLGAVGYGALNLGLADSVVNSTSRRMDSWLQKRAAPQSETWLAARNDLDWARKISPSNPGACELLGLLHMHHHSSPSNPQAAVEHFQCAIARRPGSPYTWANLAEARRRLGFPRADVEKAMLTAWHLGPSELEVQRVVVDLGLWMWSDVSVETQSIVRRALANAMRRNPYKTLPIVYRQGRLDLACPFVANDKRLARTLWLRRCKDRPAT